jgi:hypothetical protein
MNCNLVALGKQIQDGQMDVAEDRSKGSHKFFGPIDVGTWCKKFVTNSEIVVIPAFIEISPN